MHQNYKAVVFDFGGVIEITADGNPLKKVADVVGLSIDDFHKEYFKYNHLSNVDGLPWEETVAIVVSHLTDSQDLIQQSRQIILDHIASRRINRELVDFFPILRQQEYKVAIFSNNTTRLRQQLIDEKIIDLIDEAVIFGEIGFQKPHKEAFDVLFQKLNLRPEEVIFIDDAPKSLEKAEEIGYTPILFRGNDQLKEDLEHLGIKL
jgi:HAD superfamily hydrolase (TIGR01509 family)